ncbi:MAG: hypothetical protein B6242_07380 [Anaerolineaceae bacterium 4572_78]|nr:MAG: hypothetical protein B6242_07380 [Anaerolineaceae bacterium 4572_78]
MNTNLNPTDIQKIRDTLMRMYDYIDGGIPCPYPTPQEWRRRLLHEAEKVLTVIEGRPIRMTEKKVEKERTPRVRKPRAGKIEKEGLRAAILRVKKRRA